MFNIFLKVFCLFLSVVVLYQANPVCEDENVQAHLQDFSKVNMTHHDNIDNSEAVHSHKHKHSEDGEEHEHEHEHLKLAEVEFKILNKPYNLLNHTKNEKSEHSFYYKTMISNPHPFEIFRPPIS